MQGDPVGGSGAPAETTNHAPLLRRPGRRGREEEDGITALRTYCRKIGEFFMTGRAQTEGGPGVACRLPLMRRMSVRFTALCRLPPHPHSRNEGRPASCGKLGTAGLTRTRCAGRKWRRIRNPPERTPTRLKTSRSGAVLPDPCCSAACLLSSDFPMNCCSPLL